MEKHYLVAHYIKTSLNLAKTEQKNTDLPLLRKERGILVYKLAENKYVCVYAFGVVSVFGIDDKKEIGKLLRRFGRTGEEEVQVKANEAPFEDYNVIIDPGAQEMVDFDTVVFKTLSFEKILLVSHVIAQSVAIDFLDRQVEDMSRKFEHIHDELEKLGTVTVNRHDIMKTIGMSGGIIALSIGHLALLDKPDITWEDREAEALFTNLRRMYELEDRFSSLRFKTEFIQDSSELMLDIINSRRMEFMEIIIILLFIFDIALIFVDKLWPTAG